MSKRRIWLLAALVVCIAATLAVALAVAGSGSSAAAATSTAAGAPTTNFDASASYPNVLPVYFVSGTPYQMGYQYGQEAKGEIVHNACFVRATALQQYGSWAAVLAAMQADTNSVAAKTPDVLQVWQGIADGSGLTYDEIRLLNLNPNNIPAPLCSTISLWGAATKDHELIAGSNGDSTWLGGGMQGCVVVAFPANGNSFIASSPSCGTWDAIRSMNDKGLLLMMSGGQGAQPGDMGPGYPEFNAYAEMIQHCDNATQARNMFLSLGTGKGFINHFVDTSGHAYVVESTSTAHAVRQPGDFGEKDYLLATNFFETATMRPHNDPNQLQFGDLDDWYRYGTEEQLIKQDWGNLTAGSLMAILGCHNYYGARDPVTGAVDTTKPQTWHRDVLSLSPASDQGTSGHRACGLRLQPDSARNLRADQKTMYIMNGNDDPLFCLDSPMPPVSSASSCWPTTLADVTARGAGRRPAADLVRRGRTAPHQQSVGGPPRRAQRGQGGSGEGHEPAGPGGPRRRRRRRAVAARPGDDLLLRGPVLRRAGPGSGLQQRCPAAQLLKHANRRLTSPHV